METIFNYLENMFLQLPQTPEVLRAKQELGNMMEDKFQELIAEGRKENEAVGIVISEFGNLEELAEELGISQVVNHQNVERDTSRYVDREEAEHLLKCQGEHPYGYHLALCYAFCHRVRLFI